MRRLLKWLAAALAWGLLWVPAAALTGPDGGGESTGEIPSYTVSLGDTTIGAGEMLEFTTVAPKDYGFALPEGYYAGNLTVEVTGTVVVEAGGLLSIGTLAVGSTQEASPLVVAAGGSIVVKPGGEVRFVDAVFQGESVFLVQEPGALLTMTAMEIPTDLVQFGPPVADNGNALPDTVYLEQGTALTAAALPAAQTLEVVENGTYTDQTLTLSWDVPEGVQDGTCTVSGVYLDETGAQVLSLVPLTVEVVWYTPEALTVVTANWSGKTAVSAKLVLLSLPEDAQVWGEVSPDGKTWTVWENFEVISDSEGLPTGMFSLTMCDPMYFRVVAEDWEGRRWATPATLLLTAETEDTEGNRGGSTTPLPPQRPVEPEQDEEDEADDPWHGPAGPEEEAAAPPEAVEPAPEEPAVQPGEETAVQPEPVTPTGPQLQVDALPAPDPEPDPAPDPEPDPEPDPAPDPTPNPEPDPAPDPAPETQPAASQPAAPSAHHQGLAIALGFVVCAAAAVLAALLRRRRH